MSMIQLFIQSYMDQVRESFWMIMLMFVLVWGTALVLMKMELLQTKRESISGITFIAILSLAVASVLVMTLFGREPVLSRHHFEFELFWSYKTFLTIGNMELKMQIFNNILLFIPLGFALPLNFTRFEKAREAVMFVVVMSSFIEVIQGVSAIGLCEFDDVVSNAIGGMIGWLIYIIFRCKIINRKIN